jgi:hypothetical protein
MTQNTTGPSKPNPPPFNPKRTVPGQDNATTDNLKQQTRSQIAAQMKR